MSLLSRSRHIHFIGLGGIGMSGLAELLVRLGHSVSGSDLNEGDQVKHLIKMGVHFQKGHSEEILKKFNPDVVVYSSAVPKNNPEIVFAKLNKIPIIRRAEMLSELMRLKRGIAVAGSHGKTTTTGLMSLVLREAQFDPTVIIGGKFDAIGSNVALGKGDWLVAESDESDGSFLRLTPELSIVTNVDREHLDHYGSFEKVLTAFEEFIDRVPFYGRAILCSDDASLRLMADSINKPTYWYGMKKEFHPDFLIEVLTSSPFPHFVLRSKKNNYQDECLNVKLKVPGLHNVLNASAAAIAAIELDIKKDLIERALQKFTGVKKRFEIKGQVNGHVLIEDYAHHPTEIKATIEACCLAYPGIKPWVVFQPHRYTRTRDQWDSFRTCFEGAHEVITLPIYPASEAADPWTKDFDHENFAKNISGVSALYKSKALEAVDYLKKQCTSEKPRIARPILVLGAGNVASQIIPPLLENS